ncbi:uncharacterized protein LOC111242959 isoform X4 [Varroa destructor]|uniref:Serine/threonine-protein kinase greatwall n=1 Tax=Varroa destructor TaxID=109461 RepID=A0A7M7JAE5_VARDE|nr:uncharacterized protein LOC111242959 isoform X4 [Varroa destructor]
MAILCTLGNVVGVGLQCIHWIGRWLGTVGTAAYRAIDFLPYRRRLPVLTKLSYRRRPPLEYVPPPPGESSSRKYSDQNILETTSTPVIRPVVNPIRVQGAADVVRLTQPSETRKSHRGDKPKLLPIAPVKQRTTIAGVRPFNNARMTIKAAVRITGKPIARTAMKNVLGRVTARPPVIRKDHRNTSPTFGISTPKGSTTPIEVRSTIPVDVHGTMNAPSFMIHRVLTHEYFLTESACTIEDEHGVAHKVNKKAVFTKTRKDADRIVAKAEYLLECFVKQERKIKPSRTPREHFTMEQTCRTAFELFFRVRKSRLGCDDIRESLENLAFLFDYLIVDSPTVAGYLASLLRRLIMIMEEIAPLLEKGSGIAPTDWTALRMHYKTEEDNLRERLEPPIAIPPMGLISGDVILGAGGFGAVYKARFAGSIRCSVKLVDDNMFKWEQHACVDKVVGSLINHPLLVKYHACFTAQGAYITIMEYIRGVDLDRVVHTAKGLPMRVLRPVVAQLGIATQYLHFKGFIHRDIKPSNLIIMPGCRLKMIDFDTVKICIGMFSKKRLKCFFRRTYTEFNDRETAGTPNFFPPEFIKCAAYGRSVDWWAIGVTAYEMCFGKTPFRGENDEELEAAIQAVNYKFPVKGPRGKYYLEFKDLVARLIKKRASERLCSRRYSDFLAHPFFEGLDLNALEDGSHFIEYDGVTSLMQPSSENPDDFSPKISDELQATRAEYLEPEKTKDAVDHCPLYTFVSTTFQNAVRKAMRDEPVSHEDAQEPPEIGVVNPPLQDARSYKFNAYMK